MKPNLYSYATSELSQDAFLCWLLAWAEPTARTHDEALHRTAIYFIEKMLEAADVPVPAEYEMVDVWRQHHHIDVLVEINGDTVVLIEDKVHGRNHSGQLENYLATVREKLAPSFIAPIYLKTGEQSHYQDVRQKGYVSFRRADLLDVLSYGSSIGVDNAILVDFHEHLEAIEQRVQRFRYEPVAEWKNEDSAFKGVFQELQDALGTGRWARVNNERGGFMAFHWGWRERGDCKQYLQLENDTLCFKIKVEDEALQRRLRGHWHGRIIEQAQAAGLDVVKPTRFGKGVHMTVAVLEDYLAADADGLLDIDATVATLQAAEQLLADCHADALLDE